MDVTAVALGEGSGVAWRGAARRGVAWNVDVAAWKGEAGWNQHEGTEGQGRTEEEATTTVKNWRAKARRLATRHTEAGWAGLGYAGRPCPAVPFTGESKRPVNAQ